jgi:uncharacterized protein DUF4288
MQWYIASFVAHRASSDVHRVAFPSREYWCILLADSTNSAYVKSFDLAGKTVRTLVDRGGVKWTLDGITELLRVPEPPSEGSELMWVEQEYSPRELENYIRKKDQLTVFATSQPSGSDWYVCHVVLVEVHDTGSHGDSRLTWTNSHLIKASNAESAYSSAFDLGNKQASESGTHRCDDDSAHWEFAGLRDLVKTIDQPRDGGTLWFEELNVAYDQLRKMVPPRENLGAFKWEARSGAS